MATDWWPTQEGRISDGFTIKCIAEASTTEGSACKFGTSTSGQITVQDAAALGDGFGVMLRAAGAAGEAIPVVILGLVKMTTSSDAAWPAHGQMVLNSTTIYVVEADDVDCTAGTLFGAGGASYLLGMAMQTATATADEIIICVGRTL